MRFSFRLSFRPPAPRYAGASPHFASKIGGQNKLFVRSSPNLFFNLGEMSEGQRGRLNHPHPLKLTIENIGVEPTLVQERIMRTLLDDVAVVNDQNQVSVADCR